MVQARDREVLCRVYAHRYLTAEHLHQLAFPGVSMKVAQVRLRKLWAHRFLDRFYVPFLIGPNGEVPPLAGRPFYMLTGRGAGVVAEALHLPVPAIPSTPEANALGYATLEHHLVVTDLLVALEVACRVRTDVTLAGFDRESTLRTRLAAARQAGYGGAAIVPDGAFTLEQAGGRSTFYVEVVRADVKGGNLTLGHKLRRYVELNHAGFFRRVYGHELVRAVLIATTTIERAEHLRKLAEALPHGRRLFWFGAYEAPGENSRKRTAFTPATALTHPWRTTDGQLLSLTSVSESA